jgi:predicted ribosomally synthesized peptide with SipW-like signal peptide
MRRILLGLVLLTGVVSVVSLGATTAFFSDTETSPGNTFAAGAIDLLIDNESYYNGAFNEGTSWELVDLTIEKFFDFDDLKPGDYGEDTISLHVDTNDAYLCADVTLTSNNENGCNEPEGEVDASCGDPGAGEGELANLVNFIWWADDGDNVLEENEEVISQGAIGALPVGIPHTLALADSETNIWTDTAGPLPGDETLYIGKAWCFGELTPQALPQSEYGSPAEDNDGNQTAGEPADGGFLCEGSALGNESQTDSLTADVAFEAVQARHNDGFICEATRTACEPEQAFADAVVSSNQGVRKDGTAVLADRSDPNDALGAPQSGGDPFDNPVPAGEFFSLGFDDGEDDTPDEGGSIVVAFTDNVIVDGPGNDLRVWEVTGGSSYPVERVKIEVSQDGSTWHEVASSLDRDAEADLAASGLDWARFVRLTDVSNRDEYEDTADGFDLDAFSALNCEATEVIN